MRVVGSPPRPRQDQVDRPLNRVPHAVLYTVVEVLHEWAGRASVPAGRSRDDSDVERCELAGAFPWSTPDRWQRPARQPRIHKMTLRRPTKRPRVDLRALQGKGSVTDLQDQFGQIDIYLFDQLLRGRVTPGMRVLDAGCGDGRNLVYLLRAGYDVFGVDANPASIERVRRLASTLAPHLPADNFRAEPIERMTFPDHFADVVLSSAVLHFAHDDGEFSAMLQGTWNVLKPGGMLVCRLASSIGIEQQVRALNGRRCLLADGSERYLVDERLLMALTNDIGGSLLDPLKTTIVQNQRSMTTWIVRKLASNLL
jgi:tellurite methyltransferase